MNEELLLKFLLKEASPEEEARVNEWLQEPANRRQYDALRLIWDTSKTLEFKSKVDENLAWQRFQALKSRPEGEIPVRSISWVKVLLRSAAVLVLLMAAWSAYRVIKNQTDTLTTAAAVLKEELPDGSEVVLNKNSVLSYSFSSLQKTRRITLKKGEVFFKVSHDKDKPFVIDSKGVEIMVIGTAFNVKQELDATEVIVESGIVRVSAAGQQVRLTRGQRILVKEGESLKPEKNTDELYNYFRTKQFIADDTPLWRMVEVLNEAYQANIVIGNPQIRDLRLNAVFKEEQLDNILNVIAATFDIEVERQPGKIILR